MRLNTQHLLSIFALQPSLGTHAHNTSLDPSYRYTHAISPQTSAPIRTVATYRPLFGMLPHNNARSNPFAYAKMVLKALQDYDDTHPTYFPNQSVESGHSIMAEDDNLFSQQPTSLNSTPWSTFFETLPAAQQSKTVKLAMALEGAAKQTGISQEQVADTLIRWCESHRHYHGLAHLEGLLHRIEAMPGVSEQDKNRLKIVALMHDAIYTISAQPKSATTKSNEVLSVEHYRKSLLPNRQPDPLIEAAIFATEHRTPPPPTHDNQLIRLFWAADNSILYNSTLAEKQEWCEQIQQEYEPVFGKAAYQTGRAQFLAQCIDETKPDIMALYSKDPAEQKLLFQQFIEHITLLQEALN